MRGSSGTPVFIAAPDGDRQFQDAETMAGAILASGAQIVTVALRRVGRIPRKTTCSVRFSG